MTRRLYEARPPGGVIPVVVPGDLVLVRKPGLAVWAGAVAVFPDGFQFTSLIVFDPSSGQPPADFTQFPHERDHRTWLEIRYADGRYRATYQDNLASGQPADLLVSAQQGLTSWNDGWIRRGWWVTPLPPPGPVELAIHIGGEESPTGTGLLDGALLAAAAHTAEVLWPDGKAK